MLLTHYVRATRASELQALKTSAKQWVYEFVKQQVLDSVIRPGERINDAHLCAALNVSRTPVREALLMLAQEGLVAVFPRHGYFASEISVGFALDAYQLRLILEPIATAMAAERITPTEIAALRRLVDVDIDANGNSVADVIALNKRFHVTIAQISGNSRLATRNIHTTLPDNDRDLDLPVHLCSNVRMHRYIIIRSGD